MVSAAPASGSPASVSTSPLAGLPAVALAMPEASVAVPEASAATGASFVPWMRIVSTALSVRPVGSTTV